MVEEALETLRRSGGEVRLAGLTDPAKTLLVALAATELGRPTIFIVESNQRAEALVEPLRWFYRAVTGKPGHRVVHLPALEVLPYDNRSPHAEISEDRAVALWRFANGEADVMIAPVQAALWRMREAEFYRQLAFTIQRDQDIPHRELLDYLAGAGYEKQVTCEMPGQFSVRGGIIDVFSPEAPQPIRIELLGDTIESIRAFDPNTQRSTNPMERATLLPLTEFPRRAEVLERLRVPAASGREDDEAPAGFYPGWEFQEILLEDRKSTLFDLAGDPLVVEDEPSLLATAVEKYRKRMREAFDEDGNATSEPPNRFLFDDEEWSLALQLAPRLGVEHLGVAIEGADPRTLQTQPTTRYHGNVAAFMTEVRGKLAAGENVMVSAASTGELERFADICHEYEVPYRLGELEENVTVSRLAEESHGGSVPAMVLMKAPTSEGVVFTRRETGDLRQCRSFRNASATDAARALAPEDGELLQRFLRAEAGRLRGSRRSRHRPVRRLAASGNRRRERRIHAAALCRRCETLRSARAPRPDSEISVARRRHAHARQARHHDLGSAQVARAKIRQRHGRAASRALRRAQDGDRPRVSARCEFPARI